MPSCLQLAPLILAMLLLALFPAHSHSSAAPPSPVPTILDTDIGDDFDDMMALTYILSAPHLYHPLGIVVSTRNTTKRALLVAHTLSLSNRTDIPIYVGDMEVDNHGNYQYESGWVAAEYTLAEYRAGGGVVYDTCGVCALTDYLTAYDGPSIHFIEIAPVTSLAAVLDKQPSLAAKLTVFAMNGQIVVGYGNETGPQVEWNVLVDIPASITMYADAAQYTPLDGSGGMAAGLVTSPLDSTVFQQWDGTVWQHFLKYNDTTHPLAALLLDAYTHWYDAGGKNNGGILPYSPATGTSTMYDAQAAYTAAHSTAPYSGDDCSVHVPHLVTRCMCLYVNGTGYVIADEDGGRTAGRPSCVNASVVVALVGGRSNPHPAALKVGAAVLGSIAGADLTSSADDELVEVAMQ